MQRRHFLALAPTLLLPRLHAAPHSQIYCMACSRDDRFIALGGYKQVSLADKEGRQIALLDGHQEAVRAVDVSHDGQWLAAAGGLPAKKGEIKLWNVTTKQVARTIVGHNDCIYAAVFSPDGKTLATSSYDKLIKIWNVETGEEIRTLKDHIDAIYALQFTHDGTRLVSGAADRSVKIWNPATGERLYTLSDSTDGVNTLALSPDGMQVAAAGFDKSIRIWSLGEKSGKLLQSVIAHEDQILRVAWSADGQWIASASADRTIRLFDAAKLAEIRSFNNQSDWVYGLQFFSTESTLAAGRFDGTFSIYTADQLTNHLRASA